MDFDQFRDEIEKRLEVFSREQIRRFAWRCGVRALPFLSAERKWSGFTYWGEEKRQIYLYSIFNALDVSSPGVGAFSSSARAAANAAFAARDAASYANTNTNTNTNTAAYTANAAAYVNTRSDFETIISNDLEAIRTGNLSALNNDTGIYGGIWKNFLEDLNAVGCAYWARLYEDLFKNGFVVDEKELERRLNVPDEVKEQGATAVGWWLERLGDDVEMLNEARIIILGEKGAGKTSLARKLIDIDADLPSDKESTEGVVTTIWSFSDKNGKSSINAHIWDFAGHSITHSAHRCFMSARCLYIYVYNGRIERDNDPAYCYVEKIIMLRR